MNDDVNCLRFNSYKKISCRGWKIWLIIILDDLVFVILINFVFDESLWIN